MTWQSHTMQPIQNTIREAHISGCPSHLNINNADFHDYNHHIN